MNQDRSINKTKKSIDEIVLLSYSCEEKNQKVTSVLISSVTIGKVIFYYEKKKWYIRRNNWYIFLRCGYGIQAPGV